MPHTIVINLDAPGPKINRHIYGHFAEHLGRCIYDGIYVGEKSPIPNKNGLRLDIVEALKKIAIPNLRWPGGCYADEYHWMDGIGRKEDRPSMINTHWGGVTENNHFGTHEFLELCELLGCEPYICGNVGSGTVRELSQWVEYVNFDGISPMSRLRAENGRTKPWKVAYWGIGNESWGCGGNMKPEFYADQVRRYATYCRNYGDTKLYKIACGPNTDDYRWTETLMRSLAYCSQGRPANRHIQGLSLHYYTVTGSSWENKGSATEFTDSEYYELLYKAWRMDEMITRHSSIMDYFDPKRLIGLIVDEWGTWHRVEPGTNPGFLYQQNGLRDALAASLHFDIFHKHAARVTMANIAQTINVLQAMVLTEGEKMILTPTYHVFEMNTGHQDATALPVYCIDPPDAKDVDGRRLQTLSVSASRSEKGFCLISATNMDLEKTHEAVFDLRGAKVSKVTGRILHAADVHAHNTFGKPDAVAPAGFSEYTLDDGKLTVSIPAHSFITLRLE